MNIMYIISQILGMLIISTFIAIYNEKNISLN